MVSIYIDIDEIYSPEVVVQGTGHAVNIELGLTVAAIFKRMGEHRKTAALLFFDFLVNSGIMDDCVTRDEILQHLGERTPVEHNRTGTKEEVAALAGEIPEELREKYDEMRKGAAHGADPGQEGV